MPRCRGIKCEQWIQTLPIPNQAALYNASFYFPVLDVRQLPLCTTCLACFLTWAGQTWSAAGWPALLASLVETKEGCAAEHPAGRASGVVCLYAASNRALLELSNLQPRQQVWWGHAWCGRAD